MKYIWDTNIAIYYLQKQFPKKAEHYIDSLLQHQLPAISVITEIELLCWNSANEKDWEILQKFVRDSIIVELEQKIKITTIALRKTYRLKIPDAIIAATALVQNCLLLSHNTTDFKKIEGLQVIDPYSFIG
jgi:predicted nucleic acid-binding protein